MGTVAEEFERMAMATSQETMSQEIRPLRRQEYDQLVALGAFADERIELLEGQLVPMSPIGPPHSGSVQELTMLLVPALVGRAIVRIQSPFAALDSSEPEPDVAVVPVGDYHREHASEAYLIIEVAQSSLPRDRGQKQRIYARAGVPEYWIVNVEGRSVEVHREPGPEGYAIREVVGYEGSLAPRAFPDVVVEVRQILR
jgi:Uma2 family endonuclease